MAESVFRQPIQPVPAEHRVLIGSAGGNRLHRPPHTSPFRFLDGIPPFSSPADTLGDSPRLSEGGNGVFLGGEWAIRRRAPKATALGGVGALPAHSLTTTIWSSPATAAGDGTGRDGRRR